MVQTTKDRRVGLGGNGGDSMTAQLIMTVQQMQNREAWLAKRLEGIGGSDAGAIMGDNPWKSPYQLWLEKTGQVEPEDLSEKESVQWGIRLEPLVAKDFEEKTGKKVRRAGMMQSLSYPWLLADVDRLVVGEKAGLEIKTTNAFAAKEWDDNNVPNSYYWQCQHYMMVTGLPKWYIAVLIGGQHFRQKEIPRNDELIAELFEAEEKFWNVNVKQGIMPDIDGSESTKEAIDGQFSGGEYTPIELPYEAATILELLDNFRGQEKDVKAKIQEQKNKLMLMLGDNEVGMIGDRKVTYKTTKGRITVDSKKLKAEYPEIYTACLKQGKASRILRA